MDSSAAPVVASPSAAPTAPRRTRKPWCLSLPKATQLTYIRSPGTSPVQAMHIAAAMIQRAIRRHWARTGRIISGAPGSWNALAYVPVHIITEAPSAESAPLTFTGRYQLSPRFGIQHTAQLSQPGALSAGARPDGGAWQVTGGRVATGQGDLPGEQLPAAPPQDKAARMAAMAWAATAVAAWWRGARMRRVYLLHVRLVNNVAGRQIVRAVCRVAARRRFGWRWKLSAERAGWGTVQRWTPEDWAAASVGRAWRRIIDQRVAVFFSVLLKRLAGGNSGNAQLSAAARTAKLKTILRGLSPAEVDMADGASQLTLRWRLAGGRRVWPPVLVWRLSTAAPICDVGAWAPRDYAAAASDAAAVDRLVKATTRVPGARPLVKGELAGAEAAARGDSLPFSQAKRWYARVERNYWRPAAASSVLQRVPGLAAVLFNEIPSTVSAALATTQPEVAAVLRGAGRPRPPRSPRAAAATTASTAFRSTRYTASSGFSTARSGMRPRPPMAAMGAGAAKPWHPHARVRRQMKAAARNAQADRWAAWSQGMAAERAAAAAAAPTLSHGYTPTTPASSASGGAAMAAEPADALLDWALQLDFGQYMAEWQALGELSEV